MAEAYRELGLSLSPLSRHSARDIKTAYHRTALAFHPDKSRGATPKVKPARGYQGGGALKGDTGGKRWGVCARGEERDFTVVLGLGGRCGGGRFCTASPQVLFSAALLHLAESRALYFGSTISCILFLPTLRRRRPTPRTGSCVRNGPTRPPWPTSRVAAVTPGARGARVGRVEQPRSRGGREARLARRGMGSGRDRAGGSVI